MRQKSMKQKTKKREKSIKRKDGSLKRAIQLKPGDEIKNREERITNIKDEEGHITMDDTNSKEMTDQRQG